MLNIIRTDRLWTAYKFPAELIAWRDAVIGYGGARPSVREMVRRNRLIHNDMVSGAWPLTDDILMSGEDEVQSLVSLKRRFLCIRWNSPLWAVESGFVPDGYASFIEWPFIPATHAVAMTTTNKRIAIWNLRNDLSSANAIGSSSGGTNRMTIRPCVRGDDTMDIGINCSPAAKFPLPEPDATGFFAGSTSSPTTMRGFRNGVRLTDLAATIASGLSTYSFYIGTSNGQGTPGEMLPCAIPYAAIGAQLTDAQEMASYQGVRDAVAGMYYDDDDEDE